MSLDLLCDPISIDLSQIKVGSVKGKWKRNDVKVFRDKKEIQLKTGLMTSVYGAQLNSYKKDEHYMDLTTTDTEFIRALNSLDNKILEEIGNSLNLFESSAGINISNENFTGIVRNKNPFTIRVILSKNDLGNFDWALFDNNKQEIKVTPGNVCEILKRNTLCKVIFNLDRIWYFQDRFGIICKLKQLKLEESPTEVSTKTPAEEKAYLFLDD